MTPTVESMIPGPRTVRISLSFVSKPPKKRMTVRAIIPTNCVLFVSLYWIPRPALPKSIPCDEEEKQGWHPKACAHLTGDDTGEHQEGSYEDIGFEGYGSMIHRRI